MTDDVKIIPTVTELSLRNGERSNHIDYSLDNTDPRNNVPHFLDKTSREPTGEFSQFKDAIAHYGMMTQFVSRVLKRDTDYGVIRGTKKPTLYKAGAEKLCQLFKLRAEFTLIRYTEDWSEDGKHLFNYNYKCVLYYPRTGGEPVGEAAASCNSREGKYAGINWNWSLVNTIDKMAQKRAFVSAVLFTTGASEYFTVDLEDWSEVVKEPEMTGEKQQLCERVLELVEELGWTRKYAKEYLFHHFNAKTRAELTIAQLKQLLQQMEDLL